MFCTSEHSICEDVRKHLFQIPGETGFRTLLTPLDLPCPFLSPRTHTQHSLEHYIFFMRHSALRIVRRGLATAAAHPPHAGSSTSHVTAATSAIPLSNVEAQWATLSPSEQTAVHQQLEELQRKDWKTLSLAEKKAGTSYTLLPLDGGWWTDVLRSSLLCCVWSAWPSCTG
jgi:hypothetical protein